MGKVLIIKNNNNKVQMDINLNGASSGWILVISLFDPSPYFVVREKLKPK